MEGRNDRNCGELRCGGGGGGGWSSFHLDCNACHHPRVTAFLLLVEDWLDGGECRPDGVLEWIE